MGKIQTRKVESWMADKPRYLVNTNNELNLIQRKIYTILLQDVKDSIQERKTFNSDTVFNVKFADIINLLNTNDNNYIRNNLVELSKTSIVIDIFEKNRTETKVFHLMNTLHIVNDTEVNFTLQKSLVEDLIKNKNYTRLDILTLCKFDSKFSLSLYENAMSYYNEEKEYYNLPKMTLELFREMIGATSKSFLEWDKLKKRVIDTSVKEIKDKTDYNIKYRVFSEGKGKSKTHIKFYFTKNKSILSIKEQGSEDYKLITTLSDEFIVFKEQYIPNLDKGTILNNNKDKNFIYDTKTKSLGLESEYGIIPIPKDKEQDIYLDLFNQRKKSKWFKDSDLKYLVKNYKLESKRETQEDERDFNKETLELKKVS